MPLFGKGKDERFVTSSSQGDILQYRVFVDTQTGVNYLEVYRAMPAPGHYAMGITPLLNPDGTPIVTNVRKD